MKMALIKKIPGSGLEKILKKKKTLLNNNNRRQNRWLLHKNNDNDNNVVGHVRLIPLGRGGGRVPDNTCVDGWVCTYVCARLI